MKNPTWQDLLDRSQRTDTGCLEWTKSRYKAGYGRCGQRSAHVISWELNNSSVPKDLCVLHKCDNPPCIEPSHLFLGTKKDNAQDMSRKKRSPIQVYGFGHIFGQRKMADFSGEKNNNSKLTREQVEDIRKRRSLGENRHDLAKEFGVHPQTITRVSTGKRWGQSES